MKRLKKVSIALAAVVAAVVGFSPEAYAGKTYNCKGDKQIDVAMQFAIDIQSPGRIHVSAYGGSDKSGYLVPYSWRLYNTAGTQVDYFPKSTLAFVSPNMLKETNIEGVLPGVSYTIALISQDFCNNRATVTHAVTMPRAITEWNSPVLSAPDVVQTGLSFGSVSQINFSVTDDTGVQDVAVYVNGKAIFHVTYYTGVSYRWWCEPYADDGVVSVLEGPEYYVSYPSGDGGSTSLVQVVVTDAYGNQSTTSAMLWLPVNAS